LVAGDAPLAAVSLQVGMWALGSHRVSTKFMVAIVALTFGVHQAIGVIAVICLLFHNIRSAYSSLAFWLDQHLGLTGLLHDGF
jgi:hypothetical protein